MIIFGIFIPKRLTVLIYKSCVFYVKWKLLKKNLDHYYQGVLGKSLFFLQIRLLLCGILPVFLCTCLDIREEMDFLGTLCFNFLSIIYYPSNPFKASLFVAKQLCCLFLFVLWLCDIIIFIYMVQIQRYNFQMQLSWWVLLGNMVF